MWNRFSIRPWVKRGQAIAGFLCVTLGLFQLLLIQPMCVWSDVSRETESESRCETEEVDCFVQLTSGVRSRSRNSVPCQVRSPMARTASRGVCRTLMARLDVVEANPAWHSPLRC